MFAFDCFVLNVFRAIRTLFHFGLLGTSPKFQNPLPCILQYELHLTKVRVQDFGFINSVARAIRPARRIPFSQADADILFQSDLQSETNQKSRKSDNKIVPAGWPTPQKTRDRAAQAELWNCAFVVLYGICEI